MASVERKVLITGASGLLGRAILKAFKRAKWNPLGLAYSRAEGELKKVDLTDSKEAEDVIQNFQPDLVIHCAAQRFPDKVEKFYDESYKLNVETSKNLAKLASEKGAAFIFISTDYVFDGTNPPYKENDKVSPINKYGKTKADAEAAIEEVNDESIILRVPVLYGNEEYSSESAISVLLDCLLSNVPKSVSDYEIRYPSHTDDIALICLELGEKKLQDPSIKGIYQWCGLESLTKYQMVKIMAEVLGLSANHVTGDPNPSSGAPRPHNTQLCRTKLESLGIRKHTNFKEGIKEFSKFLKSS
ncbi:methionine adenosyltransferase 2 subunit beta-like [Centruroides sculpturatus]|uniref:methionine adenosyltransferase 2 subunit beta-like n=1 Tax=Centruroides sculpturatus TaxID=218467 RepID=UPI000C6E812A|nr:methionine adenosyltransferase 2 subunit beta-like [Centruroides sculpturatus]